MQEMKKKETLFGKIIIIQDKIKYFFNSKPFPKNTSRWENQAIQREYLIDYTDFAQKDDYIFFSDPDEIIKPEVIK